MRRLLPFASVVTVALTCAPVELRFGQEPDGGPPDGAPPDAGPCAAPCESLGLWCDADAGACLQCRSSADCSAPRPACDEASGRCVECTNAAQCPGSSAACDLLTHRCGKSCVTFLDCLGFDDCGPAMLCRKCDDPVECATSDAGQRCDLRIGRCVECVADGDCPAAAPRCDPTSGRCVECRVSQECPAAQACSPERQICAP